jgi:hypothetical protein
MEAVSKIIQQIGSKDNLPSECKKQWAVEIREKFGSDVDFLKTFNPSNQVLFIEKGLERCFVGLAPSLNRTKKTYSNETVKNWLIAQLIDLSLFVGIKEKPEITTLEAISDTIMLLYGFLKVTELMVFFQRFKAGKYGTFYGSIDGIIITSAINEFLEYRKEMLNKIERSHL